MSAMIRVALLVSGMLSSAWGWADVPGSHDLQMLPRFPGSQIVQFKEVAEQEAIYPQGSIRRISGRLRYEREVLAKGALTAVTYELPSSHSANEVFSHAREALQAQNAKLLYWCQGRDCGASSLWANEVFNQSILFGADDQQAYLLARLAAPHGDSLVALYSITRGNRRAYLHAELLAASSPLQAVLPTPATLLRQLRSSGALQFDELQAPDEAWLPLLARSLNQDSSLRVSLAGTYAEAWREALVAQGVRAARLELGDGASTGLRIEVLR